MRNIITIKLALILTLSALLAACSNDSETAATSSNHEENNKLEIYTTLFPIEDFTKKVGGEHVNVTNIIPVGSDAHSFEPTPKTMVTISKGDAFIYNGAGFEGYVESIKHSLKNEKVVFVEAVEGIELIEFNGEDQHDKHADEEQTDEYHDEHADEEQTDKHHDEHEHGDFDPHVWLDPMRAISMAENIKDTLIELKPEAKEEFEENFNSLKQELETLNQEFRKMVEAAPNDTFIVSHSAYGYWTDHYDLHQIGIAGLSQSNEPSQKQLKEIVEYANEHNIKYVLFEQNVTPKVAEALRNEIGADTLQLHNVSVLTEEDVKNNDDYFSLMRRNIEALRTALQ